MIDPQAPSPRDGPWLATTWPAPPDLAALESRTRALPEARGSLAQARSTHDAWKELTARADALSAHLASRPAHLPTDPAPLRQELSRAADDHTAAVAALGSQRKAHARLLDQQRRAAAEQIRLSAGTAALERQAGEERVRQEHAAQEADAAAADLPPGSAPAAALPPGELAEHLDALRQEAESLARSGVEADLRSLEQARAESAQLQARAAEWEADAGKLPQAARRDPAALSAELESARSRYLQQDADRQAAVRRRDEMEHRRRTRDELRTRHQSADRQHNLAGTLAKFLGREGLQTHLIRRAERAIVEHANQTLDKLSGGDLLLQLRTPAGRQAAPSAGPTHSGASAISGSAPNSAAFADGALDLEVIPRRCGSAEPVPVAMLSGSQKFRVAVSLALAIGQYAGGRHRCGESVIIDEGFGSLDKEGQDVMIRELHTLKGMLKRIVLVSHQESFADAFTEGYRFRLENGQTRVERFGG